MATKVHYEDNLFFLLQLTRTLEAGMSLDIDSEFFRDKILEDLLFVGEVSAKLFESLHEKTHLLRRREHLRSLLRANQHMIGVLRGLENNSLPFSAQLSSYRERLRALLSEQEQIHSTTKALLDAPIPEDDNRDQVSEEEFRFLLKNDDSEQPG